MNPEAVLRIKPESANDPLWSLAEKLRLIGDSSPRFDYIVNQPLFKQLPSIDPAMDALERALS